MRTRLLILLVLIFCVAGAAIFYAVNLRDTEDEPADKPRDETPLDAHLAREARRLVANRESIQQEDARWIADRLGDEPSAERLRELFNEREHAINRENADRIRSSYPDFIDYASYRARHQPKDNGIRFLHAGTGVREQLANREQFMELDKGNVEPESLNAPIAGELLQITEEVVAAVRKALEANAIYYVPVDVEFGEIEPVPPLMDAGKILHWRIRVHLSKGNISSAADEAELLLQLVAKADMGNTFFAAIQHVIVSDDFLLRGCILKLAALEEVPVQRLREWLTLGKGVDVDIATTLSVGYADVLRQMSIPSQLYQPVQHLEDDGETKRVEDHFNEIRDYRARYQPGWLELMEYASKPHPRDCTLEALKTLHELNYKTDADIAPNVRDAAAVNWVWAALELRILEREKGSLAQHKAEVEAALEAWPALRAEWKSDVLELWVRDGLIHGEETKPLITLNPLKAK